MDYIEKIFSETFVIISDNLLSLSVTLLLNTAFVTFADFGFSFIELKRKGIVFF